MMITRLSLGMGNNLFQYALGRRLALERNTELYLDFSGENQNRRQYALNYLSNFNMAQSVAKSWDVKKLKLMNNLSFLKPAYKNSFVKEKGCAFDPGVLNAPKNAYLVGYWQSEKYFKPIEKVLRKDMTLKKPQGEKYRNMLDKIIRSNSVSVHIRRGDYLLSKNMSLFKMCAPDYYHTAQAVILKQIISPEFFVFSDDIEWVKKNIRFSSLAVFVSDGNFTDYQELMLMAACKHNIIANSTFSWWGAWLNDNPKKTVIAPKRWFQDSKADAETEIIPDSWIRL